MSINPFRRRAAIALLLVLGAWSLWLASAYREDIEAARARVSAGSRVIATRCGPIEYAQAGSGPVVLGIHGAGGGFDQGMALLGPLAAKGYRVIAMSRFGYLRTPAPQNPSIALQADAHACLLDALGIARAAVIGVSAGAPSALEFALAHADRCTALILLVPGWYPNGAPSRGRMGPTQAKIFTRLLRSDFLFWAWSKWMPRAASRIVLGTPSAVLEAGSPSERARLARILRDILPVSSRQAGLSLEAQLTVERLSRPLESMAVPTLAISAEDDLYATYANARFIAEHVPGCKWVGYRSGGHMLVGHTDEVLATMATFLHEPGQGG